MTARIYASAQPLACRPARGKNAPARVDSPLGNFPVPATCKTTWPATRPSMFWSSLATLERSGPSTHHVLRAEPLAVCRALLAASLAPAPAGWTASFIGQRGSGTADEHQRRPHRGAARRITANTPLFVGNSLVIRQLDSASGSGEKPLVFYGNRGASGIDGTFPPPSASPPCMVALSPCSAT